MKYSKATATGLILLTLGCSRYYLSYETYTIPLEDRKITETCLDAVIVHHLGEGKYTWKEYEFTRDKVYFEADTNKDRIITKKEATDLFEKVLD